MSSKEKIVSGFRVYASRERITSISSTYYQQNEPPRVSLHRLGSEMSWLSPSEARELAEMLCGAADVAEGKS